MSARLSPCSSLHWPFVARVCGFPVTLRPTALLFLSLSHFSSVLRFPCLPSSLPLCPWKSKLAFPVPGFPSSAPRSSPLASEITLLSYRTDFKTDLKGLQYGVAVLARRATILRSHRPQRFVLCPMSSGRHVTSGRRQRSCGHSSWRDSCRTNLHRCHANTSGAARGGRRRTSASTADSGPGPRPAPRGTRSLARRGAGPSRSSARVLVSVCALGGFVN